MLFYICISNDIENYANRYINLHLSNIVCLSVVTRTLHRAISRELTETVINRPQ